MATPFVQGRLLKRELTVTINTACAHCNRPIQLEVGSDLNVRVWEKNAEPMLSVPMMDLANLKDPSIIDAF